MTPPDGEQAQLYKVGTNSIVISNYNKFEAAATQVCCCYSFIRSGINKSRIERSNEFSGEFTQEEDQEDVTGGDGDTRNQRHPGVCTVHPPPRLLPGQAMTPHVLCV